MTEGRNRMKILIVDDSTPFQIALKAILDEAGYQKVIMKESAAEAIEFLENTAQNNNNYAPEPVDLILMDVMMPEMNGIEAVKQIKSRKPLRDIPIVMVSSRDEEEKIEQAFNAGAIDYIGKPIKKIELRARVRSILKLKEETDHRKEHERELEKTVLELQSALNEIKTLTGLLPMCSSCKKIRNNKGYWEQVESYLTKRSDVEFTHGLCPDCTRQLYPEMADELLENW